MLLPANFDVPTTPCPRRLSQRTKSVHLSTISRSSPLLEVENLPDVQLQVGGHRAGLARQAQLDVPVPQPFAEPPRHEHEPAVLDLTGGASVAGETPERR